MRALLILLLVSAAVSGALKINLSAAPGLSIQNGLLYLMALILTYQFSAGRLKIELRTIHVSFLVLIVYALTSWTVAAFVIHYPGYGTLGPLVHLKNEMVDTFALFAVFFYGTRTASDALSVLRAFILVVLMGNAVMVLDVYGVIDSPAVYLDEGRLEGPFGAPNQHGAFSIMILPAIAAFVLTERGIWRVLSTITALLCVATLIMGASRGAFAAIVVAAIWSAFLLRRQISVGRVLAWVGVAVPVVLVLVIVLGGDFSEQIQERILKTTDVDAQAATSGRTVIWSAAIGRMLEAPLTLLTGFGWDVYRSLAFKYAPHNYYLWLWFNLGIVGVVSSVIIFTKVVTTARKSADVAEAALRPHLMACVFGFLGLSIALFFTELYTPWLYIWAYVGLIMRVAMSAQNQAAVLAPVQASSPKGPLRDGHGRVSRLPPG